MTNLIYYGKIIRQSTIRHFSNILLQYVPCGGQFSKYLSNKITFFHSVRRIE